ncbi:class I tRNA ligase family protein [Hungatella sp.]|uniref:class I tRNA ligase family protein n=1 Tax=Hungatella sp. TaxID=2613924 RepID=UPI0039951718
MFYDGPPTANGKPHIGHVLARVFKDMVPRYRAIMKGKHGSLEKQGGILMVCRWNFRG